VDLHLDGVAAVVDEEDDAPLLAPEHRGHVLRRHLEAAVADAGDDALVRGALGVPEQRAHGPADGAVLHLELVPASMERQAARLYMDMDRMHDGKTTYIRTRIRLAA
jgi:hypothetical protein